MYDLKQSEPYFLYVEDDAEDVELLQHALSDSAYDLKIVNAKNGEEACSLLENSKDFSRLPEVIFLDVNMPRLDGKETLLCFKADKDIARIPVIVLSTSNREADMRYFKDFHVPYLVKPGDVKEFKENLHEVLKGLLAFDFDFKSANKNTDAA